jgi:hypothetical protein
MEHSIIEKLETAQTLLWYLLTNVREKKALSMGQRNIGAVGKEANPRLGTWAPRDPGAMLEQFKDTSGTHTGPDAHGDEAISLPITFHTVEQSCCEFGAGGSQRVTEGDGPAG